MKYILFAVFMLCFQNIVHAQSFKVLKSNVQQGDVLIFSIAPQWQQSSPPVAVAIFGKHYLPNQRGEIFIGIDKNIAPGNYIATLVEYGRGVRLSWDYEEVEIVERNFLVRGKISGIPRIPGDMKILKEAYARGNRSEKYFDGDFVAPLDRVVIDETRAIGDIFSPFGGENHRGVDLVTLNPKTGKHQRPVKAINSGKVVLARKVSLEGNLVIIDHGSGIFSLYMHLSRFSVKQGESVKTGQIIGMSGKTGRVTGPHLHFGIRVGNPSDPLNFPVVDPLRFIDTMNKVINEGELQ